MNTPYFRARCNSLLRYIAFVGSINEYQIHDEERDVLRQLVYDRKVAINRSGNLQTATFVVRDNTPYQNDKTNQDSEPHPVVFHLAAENPANEEYVRVYRKNWYVPALPEYPLTPDENLV